MRNPRAWLRAHPTAADTAAALLLTHVEVGVFLTFDGAEELRTASRSPDWIGALLLVLATMPIALRRRHPLPVLATTLGANIAFWAADYPDSISGIGILVAVYTVGNRCERPQAVRALVAAEAIVLPPTVYAAVTDTEDVPPVVVVANAILVAAAWLYGDSQRSRRAYLAELELRVETAEREQAAEARRAVQAERGRLARELHDIVAHGMSVMVVQAAGARRVLATDPEVSDRPAARRAGEAMHTIEQTGREALVEMRRLLGVLKTEDAAAELAPQPGVDDLGALAARWRDADLEVTVCVEPAGLGGSLPAGIDLCAYRIVQEALTNTSRHAAASHADVVVRREGDALEVAVTDDGRGAGATDAAAGGHGIAGMRERAALYGGTVDAGPRRGGGFAVRARIPL